MNLTPMDLGKLHREESGRILSTLIGLLGDFDLAEEMLQEAYATALQKWPADGVPANPRAWLIRTARNRAIDRLRRDRRFDVKREDIARYTEHIASADADSADSTAPPDSTEEMFPDDRLRLIFTCCHPALPTEAQVALTLQTVCGVTTEEISRAFLVPLVDDGAAAGTRKTKNSRCGNSLSCAISERLARPPRCGFAGRLSHFQ